jgi:hypothetical protein
MSKRLLLLTFALTATAASVLAPRAQASLIGGGGPYHACPVCTTYPDGSQCCINCQCGVNGTPVICPENACVPVSQL